MKSVVRREVFRAAGMAGLLWMAAAPATAQWLNIPTKGLPRTRDGKVDLSAPAPKTADGKPDLSGIWEPDGVKYLQDIARDLKPGAVPLQPWSKAVFEERKTGSKAKEEPDANCLPQGVPKIDAAPVPFKIVQAPGEVIILYEAFSLYRQVFTDGRELPKEPNPSWLGYSVGHWEGSTLVVDSRGFNDKTWLDQSGYPHTEALHVIERFQRKNVGQLDIEITIDDPKTYTAPWTITEHPHLIPDTELLEFVCIENEKDVRHMVTK